MKYLTCFILALCLWCCNRTTPQLPTVLSKADSLCCVCPLEALVMLDSIKEICTSNPYIQHKWELIYLKAQDKSNIPLTTDSVIKRLIEFFDNEGTTEDRIESYYYLGRVYTELHDYPKAASAFLTAIDISETNNHALPQVYILSCAQLSYIYSFQYNYDKALDLARKEYQIASQNGIDDPYIIMDIATPCKYLGKLDTMSHYYKLSLQLITERHIENRYAEIIGELLDYYSSVKDSILADSCLHIINRIEDGFRPHNYNGSKSVYYEVFGPIDSAIYYNKTLLSENNSALMRRDASRSLIKLYLSLGEYKTACKYSNMYLEYNDSLERQLKIEQTLNASNEFQYQRDLEAEAQAYKTSNDAKMHSLIIVAFSITALLLGIIAYIGYKRKVEHKLRKQSEALNSALSQNNNLTNFLIASSSSSELAGIIERFKKAANKENTSMITESDWNLLINNNNEPVFSFIKDVYAIWPEIDQRFLRVALLHKLGFSKQHIAILISAGRSTVYRYLDDIESRLSSIL